MSIRGPTFGPVLRQQRTQEKGRTPPPTARRPLLSRPSGSDTPPAPVRTLATPRGGRNPCHATASATPRKQVPEATQIVEASSGRWAFCPRVRDSVRNPQTLHKQRLKQKSSAEALAEQPQSSKGQTEVSYSPRPQGFSAESVAGRTPASADLQRQIQEAALGSPRGRVNLGARTSSCPETWSAPTVSVRRSQTPPNVCLMGGLRSNYGIHGSRCNQYHVALTSAEPLSPESPGRDVKESEMQELRTQLEELQHEVHLRNQAKAEEAVAARADPLQVTQLWVDCQSLRQEHAELLEILQRTCRRCRVLPPKLLTLETPSLSSPRHGARDGIAASELRQLVEALCAAHEASVAPGSLDGEEGCKPLGRRQRSAPPGGMRLADPKLMDGPNDPEEVRRLSSQLKIVEAREHELREEVVRLRATEAELREDLERLRPSPSAESSAPERAPEPEAAHVAAFCDDETSCGAQGAEASSLTDRELARSCGTSSSCNLRRTPNSSCASLLGGANLHELVAEKQQEVLHLQALSDSAKPGSEDWLQATTLLAAAREELRILGEYVGVTDVPEAPEQLDMEDEDGNLASGSA